MSAILAATAVLAVLTLMPGPDFAIVTKTAIAHGGRAAATTALGIVSGLAVWGLLAVVGLAALLAASAEAFAVVKVVGAAYLIFLGLQAIWHSRHDAGDPDVASARDVRPRGSAYRTGLLANLLNPKIAIFYTSLLPQLVPNGWSPQPTLVLLVGVHVVLSILWLTGYAFVVTRARGTLERPVVRRWTERVTGTVLIAFGIRVAFERHA